ALDPSGATTAKGGAPHRAGRGLLIRRERPTPGLAPSARARRSELHSGVPAARAVRACAGARRVEHAAAGAAALHAAVALRAVVLAGHLVDPAYRHPRRDHAEPRSSRDAAAAESPDPGGREAREPAAGEPLP